MASVAVLRLYDNERFLYLLMIYVDALSFHNRRAAGCRVSLAPNYPIPFTDQTQIVYTLDKPGHVCLAVHDLRGREVAVVSVGRRPA